MHSLKNFVTLNVARLNRMRRKPLLEILTFIIKRSGQFVVHSRDRIKIFFGKIQLSDKEFFEKLDLINPFLIRVKEAINQKDLESAKKEIIAHMQNRYSPQFFFDRSKKKEIIDTLEKHFPQSRKKTIELADAFVNHEFCLLGEKIHLEENIDWHSNVIKGNRWPLSFSPNIDYFSSKRLGDIKISWELNRTQHFVILGKAYWYTEDAKYAQEFTDQLLNWMENNPYKIGINWMEGIEAVIRLFSWIWAYYYFLDSEYFNDKGHFEFLKCVYMHAKFIEQHMSDKWRLNNNHLIAEATGLVFMGIMFPEFKEAEKWRKKGANVLEEELKTQILSDGVSWEQSIGYHKFVTDLILMAVILMKKNEMKVPETILSKLNQMIDFLSFVTKNDGTIPLVGDEDQGRVIKLDETSYDDARSTITAGAVLFDREDWLKANSEEALWFFGEKALTGKTANILKGSKLFKDSGLMVMRDKNKCMLFLAGPQDPKYSHASHKHLDELSFVLEAYGASFLVDSGTYTYFGDFGWRRYFKCRKAHNTVVIDEKDPVEIKEIFESPSIPICKIQGYATNNRFDWIAARYDGYKMISHLRHVVFVKPEYWVIIDLLEGRGEHTYDLYFHFSHEVKTEFNKKDQCVTATGLGSNVKIIPLATLNLHGEILRGEVSLRYGEKLGADMLRYRIRGYAPQEFVSVLYAYKIGEHFAKDVEISQIDVYGKDGRPLRRSEATGIKIVFDEIEDYFACSHIGEQYLRFKDLEERKGKILCLRRRMGETVEKIAF